MEPASFAYIVPDFTISVYGSSCNFFSSLRCKSVNRLFAAEFVYTVLWRVLTDNFCGMSALKIWLICRLILCIFRLVLWYLTLFYMAPECIQYMIFNSRIKLWTYKPMKALLFHNFKNICIKTILWTRNTNCFTIFVNRNFRRKGHSPRCQYHIDPRPSKWVTGFNIGQECSRYTNNCKNCCSQKF